MQPGMVFKRFRVMTGYAFSLDNKLVIVTGASSSIGRQCAVTCSRAGARVILMGRDQGRLENAWDDGDSGQHIFVPLTCSTMINGGRLKEIVE